jgi:sugar phosphate isomerase/epimerase
MALPAVTFSTGSLYLYGLDRCFALAAEAGFDGIELMVDDRLDTRQEAHLLELVERYGIPILSLHAPFVDRRLLGWGGDVVDIIKRTVRLTEAVGGQHVVMHLPDKLGRAYLNYGGGAVKLPWPPLSTAPIQRWMAAGDLRRFQQETAVRICVENMPVQVHWLKAMFPQINQQGLVWWNDLATWPQAHEYLTLDTTHWATHGIDPLAAYRAANGRVRHIHLSNFKAGKEHQLPHNGELDLNGFLQVLVADGFDGQIVLEVNPRTLEAHDADRMRQHVADSLAFIRAGLADGASQ